MLKVEHTGDEVLPQPPSRPHAVCHPHTPPPPVPSTSSQCKSPASLPRVPPPAVQSVPAAPLPAAQSVPAPVPSTQTGVPVSSDMQDISRWNCSCHQKIWMKTEMEALGLWPGSRPVRQPMNMVSLWRYPPQPELVETNTGLPSPKYFQLHPFFIWKPEHSIMQRLRNNYILPCLYSCPNPQVVSSGVGRPRVILGTSGQYYILSSRLSCKACKKYWFADKPQWLDMLPKRFCNVLPAFLTHKKAICKTVMDELRRSGKSPNDMANQLSEVLHLKYERAHLAYLLSVQNIRDAEAGLYGQMTITGALRTDDTPAPFGGYEDTDGWRGVSVTAHYLVECLLQEYQRQEAALTQVLQGTFGQVFRSDHTRKVARKVTLASGTMSSYAVMNENWMILSWVMLQSESEQSLESMYCGLASRYSAAAIPKAKYQWVDRDCCAAFRVMDPAPYEHLQWDAWRTTEAIVAEVTAGNLRNLCASCLKYNEDIIVKLDLFHCMRRFTRECVSEHHPLYSSFCHFLSAAFSVVDQSDLEKLKNAYRFCGIEPANPTKQHIREHCRTKVPHPRELVQRVEEVLQHFHLAKDPNNILLFKPSMLKVWWIQRVHILRGCLSDPEVEEGILYRHGGMLQLNHVKGEGAAVPIWIPVRGTSQQEGFHFHQAQWVTGNRVSPELFQAQGMTGVARWNYQRLVDLKQPGVVLPAVFDPVLLMELNRASVRVTGQPKYPALHISSRDTGEKFGLQYVEPGCRPVPLDFDKHKCKKSTLGDVEIEEESSSGFESSIPSKEWLDDSSSAETPLAAEPETTPQIVSFHRFSTPSPVTVKEQRSEEFLSDAELLRTPPLPIAASPRAARTGPIKTGGRVFVLDHNRWTDPMRNAIDGLLAKHHGSKDLLKRVDADYAAMVQSACTDPNSLLHSTTKQHINRYIKYLAKKKNTNASLNTSPEKLLETQQLWKRLHSGSETISVPVTVLPPAPFNPPAKSVPEDVPLTQAAVEKMVKDILEKHQAALQQQQQTQKKAQIRSCLACGQPKSRYLGDGSSVHFFYQAGEVKYFYCSKKVFDTYSAEGLTNPRMPFEDFADTPFFQRELEASKQRGAERKRVIEERGKRKSLVEHPSGRLCRFCHQPLKQGPNSPHIHTGFPGVAGKYIYCPAKVLSLYQAQGTNAQMTWTEFQQSPFYEAERQRWIVEKKK
ncbi:uncharacterized protein LOC117599093 isoform X2 [Pangasianodon hypophthalmus]|uniref:uncharacterized protein LOC128318721 isoform X2 n=1 Tax=Pangasianodon hypophthalmus TaxID=310915 RepID=UPI0023079DB8|nr:uncharacterized protein LOC128318721 isoform X2 [Pangasianodon hypophthalmus]XP_053092420.1 uncharacterized protein LOC117599093 isoform X2 [Pangasianodon hypophthalmus]